MLGLDLQLPRDSATTPGTLRLRIVYKSEATADEFGGIVQSAAFYEAESESIDQKQTRVRGIACRRLC